MYLYVDTYMVRPNQRSTRRSHLARDLSLWLLRLHESAPHSVGPLETAGPISIGRAVMRDTVLALLVSGCVAASLAGCGDTATLPLKSGMGPRPILPPPRHALAPTVHIAPAEGWPEDTKPTPAAGLAVNAYANGLDHPRWLYVLPNGDVLVAETNAPQGEGVRGLKGLFMAMAMN